MEIHVDDTQDVRDAAEFHGWTEDCADDPLNYLEIKGFTVVWTFGHAEIPILDEDFDDEY